MLLGSVPLGPDIFQAKSKTKQRYFREFETDFQRKLSRKAPTGLFELVHWSTATVFQT